MVLLTTLSKLIYLLFSFFFSSSSSDTLHSDCHVTYCYLCLADITTESFEHFYKKDGNGKSCTLFDPDLQDTLRSSLHVQMSDLMRPNLQHSTETRTPTTMANTIKEIERRRKSFLPRSPQEFRSEIVRLLWTIFFLVLNDDTHFLYSISSTFLFKYF